MARARNIKPSLFKNEILGTIDPLYTLLFESLWCLADRDGKLEDRPLRIKAETFPYRENLDINGYLTELARLGFIKRYVVDGLAVIKVLKFLEHQSPHNTEKASNLPDEVVQVAVINEEIINTESSQLNNGEITEQKRPDLLIPDSPLLIPEPAKKPSRTSALDDGFEEFWNFYPKKVGKVDAQKAWKKTKPKIDDVLKALSWQVNHDAWLKQNGQYIPNPSTYINQGRWMDEPQAEVTF